MTTDAAGSSANRDLVLGVTNDVLAIGAPGLVALSKIVLPDDHVTFSAADLFGTWRVYLQRVEAKSTGSTTQIGRTSFGPTGTFLTGTLTDPGPPAVSTLLTTGSATINANGSVTGTFVAGTGVTAQRYGILGSMRPAKDLITGVLTANLSAPTATHYGVVTMVRDVTVLDLGQPAYTVTEGGKLTVTVKRTGNMAGTITAGYGASGATGSLVPPFAGTLSFGPNVATQMITLTTTANTVVDGNRSVTLSLGNTSPNVVLGTIPSANVSILDEDKGGTFQLSLPNYPVAESAKTAAVVIQRTGGAASGIVVQFRTADGTAQAGRDYLPFTAANGSVTFSNTDTSKTILVPILDTALVDGTRTFTFSLTNVSANGVLGPPAKTTSTVTIGDNDIGGTLQFSLPAYSIGEGNTSTITVLRTGGTGGVLVDIATADGTARAGHNYTANSSTLTFLGANTSATFVVRTLPDGLIEGDTTVLLSLSNPRPTAAFVGPDAKLPLLGALKNAVLTIKDAQKGVQFASSNYSVAETAATVTIGLVRTGPLTDTATVRYSTSDGTAVTGVNYVATSGVLTFAPNIATQSFPVKLLPDRVAGGPRSVLLLLSNANSSAAPPVALGPRSAAVLTIGDTDTGGVVKFSAATFSANENAGNVTIIVSRIGGTAGAVTVKYATADQPCASPPCPGLATSEDYTSQAGTLTFGPGETSKSFQVPITNDLVVEGNETFLVTLSDVQGGATLGTPSQAVVTIVDDDSSGAVQLSAATYQVNEPLSGNTSAMITVTRTGLADGASVTLLTGVGTAVSGVNYTPIATTLVFDAGDLSKTVPITVFGNTAPTGDLTVPILLTNPGNGATLGALKSAMLTIVDANRSVRFSAPAYTVNEGSPVTLTVLRGGAPTGSLTVQYATGGGNASAGTDYTGKTSTTLTFGPGVTSLPITITTTKRAGDNLNRSFNVLLANTSAGVGIPLATATVNILDIDRAGAFQFAPAAYGVVEGSPVTLTVTRTGGTLGAFNVPWSVAGPGGGNISPTSGNFSFTAGMASKTFVVTSLTNTVLDGNRSITLALGAPIPTGTPIVPGATLGAATTATLTILDNESGGSIQFAGATQTAAENVAGGMVTVPVTRTGTNLAGGVLVDYAITGDVGATLSALSGTLSFGAAAAAPASPLKLTIVNTPAAQLDRTLVVTLGNPRSSNGFDGANRPVIGALGNTSVKITDTLPRVQFGAPAYNVVEGDTAQIALTRTGATPASVTVQFTTSDGTAVAGTDYTNSSGTITVTGTGKTLTIPTFNDGALDGTKTVLLSLAGNGTASIGTPGSAVLNILDRQSAGTLGFANATASVLEGSTLRVTVTRGGSNLVGNVSVNWSATGGNAVSPDDFAPASGTLSFGPGVSSQTFDIATVDDGAPEGTESIVLSLDTPTGGAALGGLTSMTAFVIDKQQTVGLAGDVSISEKVTPATVQVVRSGVPSGVVSVTATTVNGTAVAGQDYVFKSEVVTFQAGEIAKPFTVQILAQNASTRNNNRALTVALSNPVNADLNASNTSTVTILDSRPDLIIASVSAPTSTLTGKAVSTPSTVKNIGPVAVTTPFSVGLYLVRVADYDPNNPRAGSLVASQDVPSLAAGASAAFPTSVMLDDSFPAGSYYLSAVANFDDKISEADTGNNGRSSFPAPLEVKKNLTKFKSASAAFSQSDPPAGPFAWPGFAFPSDPPLSCDVTGSVNLTGTFAINNQQGNTATGQATLTGSLDDEPVQYVLFFTGTGDDNGNVTATVNSVTFKSLVRNLTGGGNGSLTGTLDGRVLTANVSGQFSTSTGGACVFTGTLQALAQTSYQLRVGTSADVSDFGFGTVPAQPSFPIGPQGIGAELRVFFDGDFPEPKTVLFTGPAGSGITGKPADDNDSHIDEGGIEARYRVGRDGASKFPGGKWSVLYKGQPRTFTLPPFNANASFVVVFPSVTVDTNGFLTRVDWVYRDRITGANLSVAPSFVSSIGVTVEINDSSGGNEPDSAFRDPANTSFDLAAEGFAPPQWSRVRSIKFQYVDLAGNVYEQNYSKAFQIQVQARMENNYGGNGFYPPGGSHERLLSIFVDVPSGSVDTALCPDPVTGLPRGGQVMAPFNVQVRNISAGSGLPYDNPTCIDKTGTASFDNNGVFTDIFSLRTDLNTAGVAGAPSPALMAGTPFVFEIQPLSGGRQTITVPLENPESSEAILIPNPATPALKPSGGKLVDAKLGQTQTISWTKPTTFVPRDLFVSANVYTTGFGLFCSSPQPAVTLDSTQVSYKFLTSCFGQPVQAANVCVFYTGTNGEVSDACWFFFGP